MGKVLDYEVPFDGDGVLMHYATYRRHPPYTAAEWRRPEPFEARLTIEGVRSGMSAKYVMWTDSRGGRWPMFIPELLELIRTGTITSGVVNGRWIPRKRGQNFGLRYLGPELNGESPA